MFMTIKQAAEKWGISVSRIRMLCREDRIPGAVRESKLWKIPVDAKKPSDGRFKRSESPLPNIDEKKSQLESKQPHIEDELEQPAEEFAVEYTDNSNTKEKNTLTLHKINPKVLQNISNYRNKLEAEIDFMLQHIRRSSGGVFFDTPNFRLYFLILENMRMNINYLLSFTYLEYDSFDFIGVRRNLRSSIEAYFELFNLTKDAHYYKLLEYYHNKKPEFKEKNPILEFKYPKHLKKKNLSISAKANISRSNGINAGIFKFYESITQESNSYVHYDIFTPKINIKSKGKLLRKLMNIDCQLLADAFDIITDYCKMFGKFTQMDPYKELDRLKSFNNIEYVIEEIIKY